MKSSGNVPVIASMSRRVANPTPQKYETAQSESATRFARRGRARRAGDPGRRASASVEIAGFLAGDRPLFLFPVAKCIQEDADSDETPCRTE
jgi:hypothetical protein